VDVEYVACDLCGSTEQTLLFSKIDHVTGWEFNVLECSCGMAFVNPMPSESAIHALYPENYLKDKAQENMASVYPRMASFLPKHPGGSLLDIGCGRGDFIHYASSQGWNVQGVDFLEWADARPVPIRVGDFLQMDFGQQQFEVVTAWAVLEHVRRPSAFFEKVGHILKDKGSFVFLVPNFTALGMRCSCAEDVPRHLHLFSPQAVAKHLGRCGMRVRAILHNSAIYTSYPFGLLRAAYWRFLRNDYHCRRYDNRSVLLLRNRQIRGNLQSWLKEVFQTVALKDMLIDAADLALGVFLANLSKVIKNYGTITVIAGKDR
jgi:2-polyprenyl-3-methyl-5-hydroxy-6-metoxy-1,4-benzoquinol methylase